MLTGDELEGATYDLTVVGSGRRGHVNMHGIALDYSAWPVIEVTPPPYSLSDDALLEFMAMHRQVVRRLNGSYALILDLRQCDRMSRQQRKKMTDILGQANDDPLPSCLGTVLVFSSPMLRGMLSAVFWLFRPPYPVKVVPDLAEAQRVARALLPGASLNVA